MITYFIKSTVSLIVLYAFFHFFLRQHKILIFNRVYLIFSLVFSMIIPLINIPVKTDFIINNSIEKLTLSTGDTIQGAEMVTYTPNPYFYQYIFTFILIIISSVLLIRFTFNIFKIINKTINCLKIETVNTSLILVEEKTLPYSFFRYVFVNRTDFENGKIEKELLMHEEAHCLQYHSIDIIILELINIFFWFNPAIWFYRKAILLNHEYYADNKVLVEYESFNYPQLLINLVIQNNTNYLVSNFKYSLIKNRLIMMAKNRPSNNAILRKIAGITAFLFLGIALTFSKENVLNINNPVTQSDGMFALQGNEKPELFPIKKGEYTEQPSCKYVEEGINQTTKPEVSHYGFDIVAKIGTEVIATAGGKVIEAMYAEGGYGNTIIIDHGAGYQSTYAHLKDFNVKNGDSVTKGQTIGHVGITGTVTSPHLYFEIRVNGAQENPLKYLK